MMAARAILKSVFVLCAILWSATALAGAKQCAVQINVNDSESKVYVDGADRGAAPVVVACKAERQKIRVVSSDNQEFTRVLAAANESPSVGGQWNVVFRYGEGARSTAASPLGAVAIPAPGAGVRALGADQSLVLQEVREMKALLNKLVESFPTLAQYIKPSQNSARKPNSIEGIAMGGRLPAAKGIYLQLHALMRRNYSMANINSDLASRIDPAELGSGITLCSMKIENSDRKWTKVLIGPFDATRANNIKRQIGKGTFMVRDPICKD